MRIRLNTIIGMVVIIGGASIVGRVIKVISLNNPDFSSKVGSYPDEYSIYEKERNESLLNSLSDHLMWFIQISDLHFSIFHDKDRISDFAKFANETVDVIKPLVVLASGDLTDAKNLDDVGSRQYIEEWEIYSSLLRTTNIMNKTIWLDIRGNHDNFDVPSLSSNNNYYQLYSIQGPTHSRSYMYTVKKGYDGISFIAVDACLLPGPRRPFNFIGVLTAKEMAALKAYEEESRKVNYTVWFGHYPTSCIISPEPGIRQLMGNGLVYLCGHLHTLGGLFPNLYTRQHTGSLELELGDWKDSRLFRVAAIDHGLFSFTDISIGEWPVILITNPKNALFTMTQNEPLHLISLSSHVRVLVWSFDPIIFVKMRLTGDSWHRMTHIDGPLYTASWDPSIFSEGIHTVEVLAKDAKGRQNIVSQPFSLDGSQPEFKFWSRVILMSNVSFVFFFGISICLCIIPLCIIRWMVHLVQEKKIMRPRIKIWFAKLWLRKLWTLCCIDRLFWPIVLYTIYVPLGPWFIGEVLEGHIGVVFAWGTFVYSSYLPGSLTYAYGFMQAVTYHCPLILLTANSADLRFQTLHLEKPPSIVRNSWSHLLFAGLILSQAINAYFFLLAYGTMALLLGPLRTWATFLGLYLWYQSSSLKPRDLRSVAVVWAPRNSYAMTASEGLMGITGEPCTSSDDSKRPSVKNESSGSEVYFHSPVMPM